jgi:rhodanese-related sulfurtransferase
MKSLNKLLGRAATDAVMWLEADELVTSLVGPSPPLVIDVRGSGEFDGPLGHIDGAQSIPLDQIPMRTPDLLGVDRDLVMVCHTDRRSLAAAEHVRRAGGKHVSVLRGGMVAWRSRQTS